MTNSPERRLRDDLPFKRIALVLSGGGALGAYEVGVLRTLERIGLEPSIVAGVSVGAINAVLWIASGFKTEPLVRVWSGLRPSTVGIRWITLVLRALGVFVFMLATIQVVLTLAGSQELSPMGWFRRQTHDVEALAVVLDLVAWTLVAIAGMLLARSSRRAEDWMSHFTPPSDPDRLHRRVGWLLVAGAFVHLVTWSFAIPWPQRFSATVLLAGSVLWLLNRPGKHAEGLRTFFLRALPETGGRGLWGSAPRRRTTGSPKRARPVSRMKSC
jgi:hypothetical protein